MKKFVILASIIIASAFVSMSCGRVSSSPNPGVTCTPSYIGHMDAAVTSPALGSNILFASKYSLPAASQLIGFSFNPLAASGSVRFAMYVDNGGFPGALIAQTAFTPVFFPGPQTIDISPRVYIGAGNYWLACLTDSASVIALDTTGSTGGSRYITAPACGYGALPGIFSANGAVATDATYYILMSAYVACQ
jgi:hypothetical protein